MGVRKMKKLLVGLVLLTSTIVYAADKKEAPGVPVEAFTVTSDAVKITKKYPATIKAEKSVNIIARVSGAIENRYFTEGSLCFKYNLTPTGPETVPLLVPACLASRA